MAGTRVLSNVISIMRRVISRRNKNDPDSTDDMLITYINDAISLTMSEDVKVFEQYGTLEFTIDETTEDGVFTFNDVGAAFNFTNISIEALISQTDPVNNSTSWSWLDIYLDPGEFYSYWGINNTETLIRGYPTQMLYYGTEMVFRTLPDQSYDIKIYGYKQNDGFASDDDGNIIGDPNIPFDYWVRYLAYLASLNYVRDFNYAQDKIANVQQGYARERKLLLTRTFNQRKITRCFPRF